MFEQTQSGLSGKLPGYTLISFGVHGLLVAAALVVAGLKSAEPVRKEVEVSFLGPGKGKGPPPPPPPPAGKKRSQTPKRVKPTLARIEIPKAVVQAPKVVEPRREEPEEEDDGAQEGGVEGGVKGGVAFGVVGGVAFGTGGGGAAPPPEAPKAKNVPAFAIQKDAIQQTRPRLSEVFKRSHVGRNEQIAGMYKVCVGTDGHVYDVVIVKSVAGADEEIVEAIRGGWLYKPQPVPVCFLYNMPIILTQ